MTPHAIELILLIFIVWIIAGAALGEIRFKRRPVSRTMQRYTPEREDSAE